MRVIFEMSGGPYDGQSVDSESDDLSERDWAATWFLVSTHGKVGARFMAISQGAREVMVAAPSGTHGSQLGHGFHVYEVTDRLEDGGQVYVRAKYVGRRGMDNADPATSP
jgi:hypothetical protein